MVEKKSPPWHEIKVEAPAVEEGTPMPPPHKIRPLIPDPVFELFSEEFDLVNKSIPRKPGSGARGRV